MTFSNLVKGVSISVDSLTEMQGKLNDMAIVGTKMTLKPSSPLDRLAPDFCTDELRARGEKRKAELDAFLEGGIYGRNELS